MITRLDIRKIIDNTKEEYSKTGELSIFVNIAILKGLYIALGGTKYITVPTKFDNITCYSIIVFKHKLKLSCKSESKITQDLVRSLIINNKKPEYFLNNKLPTTNDEIANLLVALILSVYTEDMVINSNNIHNLAKELLDKVDEKGAGA